MESNEFADNTVYIEPKLIKTQIIENQALYEQTLYKSTFYGFKKISAY